MLCMTVYLLHRTILPLPGWAFGNAHLHDLMAMPILLGWIDLIMDHRSPAARIYGSVRFSIALTAVCAFTWEVVMPLIDPTSWSDWRDVLCYAIGAAVYLVVRNALIGFSPSR